MRPTLRPRRALPEELAISVRGLRKRYGERAAVDGIDLDVRRGEIFALLGPNGAGKTTTVEILEGYRARSAGEVSVIGHDPAAATREWRDRIGIVLQSNKIADEVSVVEVIDHMARYYSHPRPTDEVILLVGLDEKRADRVSRLSGGQQRRLDVALGIIGRPELLFLDGPTTGFRSRGSPPVLGSDRTAPRRGYDHPAHHPLPRRGRGSRRPGRCNSTWTYD